jgi:hypothetical protein
MIKTLTLSNSAERLTWKSGKENVKFWNFNFRNLSDVAMRQLTKICGVSLLGMLIPFGRKDTLTARALKPKPHSTDPGKQINELEIWH